MNISHAERHTEIEDGLFQIVYGILQGGMKYNSVYDLMVRLSKEQKSDVVKRFKLLAWKVEIEAIEGDEEKADSKAIKTSDLAVSNVSENVDKEDESISYTGQITNKSKTDTDGGMVVVLLKNKGKIVGTGYEYVDVKAGKKKAFDFTVYGLIEHDKYEMYAYSDYVSD